MLEAVGTRDDRPRSASSDLAGGEAIWHLGALVTIALDGAATDGALAIVEELAPEGMRTPPHLHRREDETFVVLEGEVSFDCDGEATVGGPGAVVHLPRGVPHSFEVTSKRARFLNLLAPAGFEGFFRAMGEPAPRRELPPPLSGRPDIEQIKRVAARFECEVRV